MLHSDGCSSPSCVCWSAFACGWLLPFAWPYVAPCLGQEVARLSACVHTRQTLAEGVVIPPTATVAGLTRVHASLDKTMHTVRTNQACPPSRQANKRESRSFSHPARQQKGGPTPPRRREPLA